MAEASIAGITASEGIAIGTFFLRREMIDNQSRTAGTVGQEQSLFEDSLAKARQSLAALMARVDVSAAEILGFQHELLSDTDFLEPVFQLIGVGQTADEAWTEVIEGEIAEYTATADEYMSARTDDLRDLQRRVLGFILGTIPESFDVPEMTGLVLAATSLAPSEFLELDLGKIAGIAISEGSPTSHVSILARARGIPMLVGCGTRLTGLKPGYVAVIDTHNRQLIHDPHDESQNAFRVRLQNSSIANEFARRRAHLPAVTASGDHVRVYANVDDPAILLGVDAASFDGIGLTRTEFLFVGGHLPDEDHQMGAYRRIIEWAAGRPVTIRTLDAGGDKPIPGVTFHDETNPFLGIRGYRLSRIRKDIFATQLRALARAAVFGPLKVMIPMVTVRSEMDEFRTIFTDVINSLQSEGIACAVPSLGVMIEVPSAALNADSIDADFFSIGSNDLIQYVTACARDNALLAHLAQADNPAVIKLISMVAATGLQQDKEVSVCGDMASTPALVPLLLKAGIRCLSVAIAQGPAIKEIIRGWDGRELSGDGICA